MSNKRERRILIVEDEKPMAKALELKLNRSGFKTSTVFDGESAYQTLLGNKFDLILLDLVLPKVDGFNFLRRLKKAKINIPIIIVSNLGQEEDARRAKEMGAVEYFVKSSTPIVKIVEFIEKFFNA